MALQPTATEATKADHRKPNRLIHETSPYLLQHAYNPVDWWPWGPEAFAEARRRGVPIFLSIGYSTCYWCHVMERESFESEAIARQMNENFVCIKVDREERPDVDEIYMTATQLMTGRGGWPMTIFVDPETLKPFYCGTYFPAEARPGMPSLPQVIEGMSEAWTTKHDQVLAYADQLAGAVKEQLAANPPQAPIGEEQVTGAVQSLLKMYDRANGGFGGAPKFPQPVYLELLLDARETAGDDQTRQAIDQALRGTLDHMATGGMNDQVGGGFHRYSVDGQWIVPHFEKMLYGNAQLAAVYARAGKVYGDEYYSNVARRTLEYVLREMTSPQGAFYSAQDAEVDAREGANYIWRPGQMRAILGKDDGALAERVYGIADGTNFQDPHHPDEPPANVLRLGDRPERVAARIGQDPAAFGAWLERINERLYAARMKRKQPSRDDKVIVSWNGLMIGAMADMGRILGEPRYVQAAGRAVDFILANMRSEDGSLLRTYRDGRAKTPAFLEDYAALIDGLLRLERARRAAGDETVGRALDEATLLADQARDLFADPGTGRYHDTRADQSDLFVRGRSTYDGAVPSGSSMMLLDLTGLHEMTGQERYMEEAIRLAQSLSPILARSPLALSESTRALMRLLRSDADVADKLAEGAHRVQPPMPVPNSPEPIATPVQVLASTDRVSVSENEPGEVTLKLKIADGYHIVAADPGPGGQDLIPLRVFAVGGTGVKVYADYPPGQAYGDSGEIRVHRGNLDLRVAVERSGDLSGTPRIAVTYQVCTDTECLAPRTVKLDVAIDAR